MSDLIKLEIALFFKLYCTDRNYTTVTVAP